MTLEEILKQGDPDRVGEIALSLQLAERLDPDTAQEMMDSFQRIESYVVEKVKTSSIWNDYGKPIALVAGAGLAANALTDLYEVARRGLTKARNWKRINTYAPNLRDLTTNPHLLRPAYNTLHRAAPEITADPMVAVPALVKMTAMGEAGNQLSVLKDVIDAKGAMMKNKSQLFNSKLRLGGRPPGHQED